MTCEITLTSAAGWIGFFWIVWLSAMKSMYRAKQTITLTSSATISYFAAWRAQHDPSLNLASSKSN